MKATPMAALYTKAPAMNRMVAMVRWASGNSGRSKRRPTDAYSHRAAHTHALIAMTAV